MNATPPFELDPRLAQDTLPVCDLELCRVLLMNDSRYPWFILVPRVPQLSELTDLDESRLRRLWDESLLLCRVMKQDYPDGKLNLGALGNLVSQLHLHHVMRHAGDPAWPGPVWGHSAAVPYEGGQGAELAARFAALLQG
jgi:diadenosine tetraphosphate (Ap4A) HIT family hydrolase